MSCSENKQANKIPIEDFFKNPVKTNFTISPDGKYIAYLKPYKNRLNVYVEKLNGKGITRLTSDTLRGISYYFWANSDEILYLKDKDGGENPRLFAVKRDGTNTRNLVSVKKAKIKLITPLKAYNDVILVALNIRDSTIFDAYRLNIQTSKLTLIGLNPGNITEWYADFAGKLRMAVASDGVNETLLYRKTENDLFKSVVSNNFKTTIALVGFSKDNSSIYALSNQNRDKISLVELDCETGKERREIYSNPQVDITEGYYLRSKQKVVYVEYETDKKHRHYLDDDIKAMYSHLEKSLPDKEIKITDQDTAENNFIIKTYTDRNPGTYYLYVVSEKKLIKLGDINPSLKENELCEMKPISYKSRDGLVINGYLTLPKGKEKNLSTIIVPHGGPSYRNSWSYNAEVQFLANRGYAVFQMNYRGSTGYGKDFWNAGFKEWGGKMQSDVTDGVKWLIAKGIANPKRIGIYGSSFGGYSALHGLCFNSDLYVCGASYSGITNLFTFLKDIPSYYKPYQMMFYEMVGNPETDADYLKLASPIFHTDKIKVPVLIAQGVKDPRVNVNETNQFVKELKKRNVPVTYILKDGEGHFFKKQENRLEFYGELEKFLESNLNKK
ncbi:MAG: S9 family peptidase [Daejeonella sp.]